MQEKTNYTKKKQSYVLVLVYLLSLFLRLLFIGKGNIYSDEITWMVRGKELIYSIIHKNEHYLNQAWWNNKEQTEAIGLPLVVVNGLFQISLAGQSKASLKLLPDITAARLPVAILGSFLPVAILYFGMNFVSYKTALIASILYAVNPIVLGLDRWVIHDSFLTLFSFLSLTSFFIVAKRKKLNIAPGIFLALAFLTKPNGILPIIGWCTFYLFSFRSNKKILKILLANLAVFFMSISILWPASWNKPVIAIFEYMYRQTQLVQSGMTNYYLGQVTSNPNWTYYFFQLATRLPEMIVIGALFGIYFGSKKLIKLKSKNLNVLFSIVAYFLAFLAVITVSPKKLGVRYALPLFPWIILIASYGLKQILDFFKGKRLFVAIINLLIILSVTYPIFFIPDYYLYYNKFIGGAKGAQKYDLVGVCSSSKAAFDYLNKVSFKGSVYVAGCPNNAPYYSALPITENFEKADLIVVETYLKKQHPECPVFEHIKEKTPWKTFTKNGAVIAEIYK